MNEGLQLSNSYTYGCFIAFCLPLFLSFVISSQPVLLLWRNNGESATFVLLWFHPRRFSCPTSITSWNSPKMGCCSQSKIDIQKLKLKWNWTLWRTGQRPKKTRAELICFSQMDLRSRCLLWVRRLLSRKGPCSVGCSSSSTMSSTLSLCTTHLVWVPCLSLINL